MQPRMTRIGDSLLSIMGLGLVLFAFPISFVLFVYFDYSIYELFKTLGIMVELRGFLTIALTILLGLLGYYLWHLQISGMPRVQLASDSSLLDRSLKTRQLYIIALFFLCGVGIIVALGLLGILLVIVLLSLSSSFAPRLPEENLILFIYILYGVLCLFQIVIAFYIARYHWRVLQSTHAKNAAE